VQADRHRELAYRRAAATIMGLPLPLTDYLDQGLDPGDLPNIGASSTRAIAEFLLRGESPTVEGAIDRSGRRAKVEASRRLRDGFLSLAGVRAAMRSRVRAVAPGEYLGDLQMHSTWSDGAAGIATMAEACARLGHVRACMTDHSAGLAVAGGMGPEQVRAQQREIDALNDALGGRFRVLKGIEANVGLDGSVDVPHDERRGFDLVIAAPHSGLRLDADQTPRMLRAVSEPGIHVLGHPRGRKFGARAGVRADWHAVFRRAAETGVAIELDGSPERQDVDHALAAEALAAGCVFALDSDAHAPLELPFSEYALAHARLARVPADRVINCWPEDRLREWADRAHRRPVPRG
jgi:putative hydrolase